jgi:8-oxo-dGTP pyrophosphatase MutT (NUDIX family)
MANETEPSREPAKEFLLAEYTRFSEAFWQNEATGETRVNWFLGIVTAALGGLVTLATKAEGTLVGAHLRSIVLIGLAAILVLGIVTFARMLIRNERTDQYKYALDTIRQKFQDHFDGDGILLQYNPLGGPWDDDAPKRKLGGLVHNVAAINSLVIGLGVGVASYTIAPVLLGLVALAGSFAFQYWLARRLEGRAKDRLKEKKITHAGGVVFCFKEGKVHYLILHPFKKDKDAAPKDVDTNKWVLPKGKVKSGEKHADAALREVSEEAGVRARVICPVGVSEYSLDDKDGQRRLRVKFYLMEKVAQRKSNEKRDPKWLEFKDAFDALTFDETKEILECGEEMRKAVSSRQ